MFPCRLRQALVKAVPPPRRGQRVRRWAGLLCLWAALTPALCAAPVVLYSTGFEAPTFTNQYVLDLQDGWYAYPEAEVVTSQVVKDFLPGKGQQALIGFASPSTNAGTSVSAYRPVNFTPGTGGRSLVVFSVTMAIVDSESSPRRDAFRWSVYDQQAERLFGLEFDNLSTNIFYVLDDGKPSQAVGRAFLRDSIYDLVITMNFASNNWSASLNGELIVNAARLTTRARKPDLGDVDAVWVSNDSRNRYGDNYMLFDDYRLVADTAAPLPCTVQPTELHSDGSLLLRLVGEPGRQYALEGSPDLRQWTALTTNTPADGTFYWLDTAAPQWPKRFYRGRAVWP